ncbi:hypothetical protein C2845_PM01G18900 [Panicum miliaceum]|uniref:Uncharacterized protein n=1 Tax=Panicum miliaceum TaxID=4540 RepID=A0A3L6TQQ2_PANMI|nr:hypothetical protein C2845_PM01G18900 [Panicum miliaceum]
MQSSQAMAAELLPGGGSATPPTSTSCSRRPSRRASQPRALHVLFVTPPGRAESRSTRPFVASAAALPRKTPRPTLAHLASAAVVPRARPPRAARRRAAARVRRRMPRHCSPPCCRRGRGRGRPLAVAVVADCRRRASSRQQLAGRPCPRRELPCSHPAAVLPSAACARPPPSACAGGRPFSPIVPELLKDGGRAPARRISTAVVPATGEDGEKEAAAAPRHAARRAQLRAAAGRHCRRGGGQEGRRERGEGGEAGGEREMGREG